jgi:exosortase
MENQDRATTPGKAGEPVSLGGGPRAAGRFQILGLLPHEILLGALLLVYLLASPGQKRTLPFEALYFGLVIATIPVLCFRCLEHWRQLEGRWLFLSLVGAWLAFFQLLGNSTFGYVDTPSLFHWMYNAYTSESPTADDGHGLLIPFVVLGLFWWKRQELFAQAQSIWWPGILLLALAVVLHVVGYLVQQPRVCIVGLFTGIYGLLGMTWGTKWLRASFFPYCLLVFMVPLGSLTERVTFPLRLMVTKLVALICQYVLAIDVQSVGTSLIRLPNQYQYEVAAACSGMRSLMAISALAIIYAFMVFRSWRNRGLLIASALPLAVIGNTFRMLVIVLAAEFWGNDAGLKAHDSAFWSMLPYVPAFVGLLVLGRWLEKREAKSASSKTGQA